MKEQVVELKKLVHKLKTQLRRVYNPEKFDKFYFLQ